MKKFTSTLTMLLACLYLAAQPGTPDAGFNPTGTPGYTITDIDGLTDHTTGMAVKASDNSIYVTGYVDGPDDSLFIIHYLSGGTPDPAFGTNGIVKYQLNNNTTRAYAIGLQSTGTVVVAGTSFGSSGYDFFIGRFNGINGSVINADVTQISAGTDEAHALAIKSNDNIVLAGFSTGSGGNEDIAVAGYTAAGTLDGSFNGTTGFLTADINTRDIANAVAIDKASGDIIVAGTSNYDVASSNFAILRLTSAGAYIPGFDGDGILIQDINSGSQDEANAVAIDGNGKIVVAGTTKSGGPQNIAVIRLSAAGVLDAPAFNTTGIVITDYAVFNSNDGVTSVAIQSDNKIVVGGSTDASGTTYDLMLLRYTTAGALDAGVFGAGLTGKSISPVGVDVTGAGIKLLGNKIYAVGYTTSSPDVVLAAFNNDATPLPLVLSQFYAQKQTSKVVLQWSTASETDVKQFVIERSNDGKTYKAIGTVAATGNSAITKNYSFADQSPFMSNLNYYRLKMQDVDGNYKYSKVLTIKFDGQLTTSMQVYPNPVKDLLQVQLPDGLKGTVSLQIIDMQGRTVRKNNLASDGNALNTTVDVNSLLKGLYILKAQAGNTTVVTRFTKQ